MVGEIPSGHTSRPPGQVTRGPWYGPKPTPGSGQGWHGHGQEPWSGTSDWQGQAWWGRAEAPPKALQRLRPRVASPWLVAPAPRGFSLVGQGCPGQARGGGPWQTRAGQVWQAFGPLDLDPRWRGRGWAIRPLMGSTWCCPGHAWRGGMWQTGPGQVRQGGKLSFGPLAGHRWKWRGHGNKQT